MTQPRREGTEGGNEARGRLTLGSRCSVTEASDKGPPAETPFIGNVQNRGIRETAAPGGGGGGIIYASLPADACVSHPSHDTARTGTPERSSCRRRNPGPTPRDKC